MAEQDLSPVPYKSRLLTNEGFLTNVWATWLRQLFFRVGGNIAKSNTELDVTGPGSVTTAMLDDDSVTAAKLRDSAITDGDRAVTTNHIRDTAVTAAKVAPGAITPEKISAYRKVTGTRAVPVNVTTAGITPSTGYVDELIFVQGSGGPIDILANPQIVAGTTVGQVLSLVGRSDTNTLLLEDGNGLDLNGEYLMGANSEIGLSWDGTNWSERYRR